MISVATATEPATVTAAAVEAPLKPSRTTNVPAKRVRISTILKGISNGWVSLDQNKPTIAFACGENQPHLQAVGLKLVCKEKRARVVYCESVRGVIDLFLSPETRPRLVISSLGVPYGEDFTDDEPKHKSEAVKALYNYIRQTHGSMFPFFMLAEDVLVVGNAKYAKMNGPVVKPDPFLEFFKSDDHDLVKKIMETLRDFLPNPKDEEGKWFE